MILVVFCCLPYKENSIAALVISNCNIKGNLCAVFITAEAMPDQLESHALI